MTRYDIGQRLTHRENPGLGVGVVVSVDGRTVEVHFPAAKTRLRYAMSKLRTCMGAYLEPVLR